MDKINAFLRGMREFRSMVTWNFGTTDLDAAYDWGREWAHRLTLRHFEPE